MTIHKKEAARINRMALNVYGSNSERLAFTTVKLSAHTKAMVKRERSVFKWEIFFIRGDFEKQKDMRLYLEKERLKKE